MKKYQAIKKQLTVRKVQSLLLQGNGKGALTILRNLEKNGSSLEREYSRDIIDRIRGEFSGETKGFARELVRIYRRYWGQMVRSFPITAEVFDRGEKGLLVQLNELCAKYQLIKDPIDFATIEGVIVKELKGRGYSCLMGLRHLCLN
jgi:hypothetical protein